MKKNIAVVRPAQETVLSRIIPVQFSSCLCACPHTCSTHPHPSPSPFFQSDTGVQIFT